ncbi:MAG TPA: N-acetylmuramoyl-L-alanine amidase [Armatimonadota bacterium]
MHKLIVCLTLALLTLGGATAGTLDGVVICVDPGHPSANGLGATGPAGSREYVINYQVAERLGRLLRAAGAKPVLTKQSVDDKVSDRRRAEIANQARAVLTVRLHCDSGGPSGFAVYYPDKQGTAQGVSGPSKQVRSLSKWAAGTIYGRMLSGLKGSLPGRQVVGDSAATRGGEQGALTGSIFSRVPVVTVEMVMLTNPSDERFIQSPEGQLKIAQALVSGIAAHCVQRGLVQVGGMTAPPTIVAATPVSVTPPPAAPRLPLAPGRAALSPVGPTANLGLTIACLLLMGVVAFVWSSLRRNALRAASKSPEPLRTSPDSLTHRIEE